MGISYAVISGSDSRSMARRTSTRSSSASTGGPGGPVADGWPTYYLPVAASLMYHDSTEVDEQKYPLHVHVKRLIPDSEGAGRHRGSFGSEVVYSPKNLPMTIAYSFEGHENPARGVRGGGTGSPSDGWLIDVDGSHVDLPMASALEITAGQRVLSRTGGGGGYGDPLDREPALVAEDAREGLISRGRAFDVYGVVLLEVPVAAGGGSELVLDAQATAAARARRSPNA